MEPLGGLLGASWSLLEAIRGHVRVCMHLRARVRVGVCVHACVCAQPADAADVDSEEPAAAKAYPPVRGDGCGRLLVGAVAAKLLGAPANIDGRSAEARYARGFAAAAAHVPRAALRPADGRATVPVPALKVP